LWQSTAVGTAFSQAVAAIDANGTTDGIELDSLPLNGINIYRVPGGPVSIALFRIGLGRLVWFGWDWSDGFPGGTQNGGWVDNLGRGVLEAAAPGTLITAPEPGGRALAAVTLVVLLGYRRAWPRA
jgi:hypothetical protein